MSSSEWAANLDRAIENVSSQMVEVRRHLHEHPEPSGEERQTSLFIKQVLERAGFRARLATIDRGLIVEPGGTRTGPRIAIRADIDALLIQDAKETDYRSRVPGVMHACGHDAHTATVMGTLMALEQTDPSINWRGIFQPAEETNAGALEMIEAGAMNDVDAIVALHVDPSRPVGTIGIRFGAFTAACDEMEIRIKGRGGHAARPHESLDPIAAAAQLISSIYLFVPRAVDSHDPVVVTIGQIAGGHTCNAIPSEVVMRGTVRTLGGPVRRQTKDHIRQLARGLSEASGTDIQVEFLPGPESVWNHIKMTTLVQQISRELLGADNVHEIARPSMGGEDFAHYLQNVPGCMFRLGTASGGEAYPLHSPHFDIDERAMTIGAKILARTVVAWSRS